MKSGKPSPPSGLRINVWPIIVIFLTERHGSADPTPCGGYAGPDCSAFSFSEICMAIRACRYITREVIGDFKLDERLAVTGINQEIIQRFPARRAFDDLAEAKNGIDPG